MEKKYQIFISSTYEDLKEERDAAIHTILTMNQFPIGMEMFSAANEEQWKIIKEAIDSSDYYILIIGNRYGSIEEKTGISYTEKEFDYAVAQGIPVLAYIVDENVSVSRDEIEPDEKRKKLREFKEKVEKSGRYVKKWSNKDNLETLISQSISKALQRDDRPGWIRTSDITVEKKEEAQYLSCNDLMLEMDSDIESIMKKIYELTKVNGVMKELYFGMDDKTMDSSTWNEVIKKYNNLLNEAKNIYECNKYKIRSEQVTGEMSDMFDFLFRVGESAGLYRRQYEHYLISGNNEKIEEELFNKVEDAVREAQGKYDKLGSFIYNFANKQ